MNLEEELARAEQEYVACTQNAQREGATAEQYKEAADAYQRHLTSAQEWIATAHRKEGRIFTLREVLGRNPQTGEEIPDESPEPRPIHS